MRPGEQGTVAGKPTARRPAFPGCGEGAALWHLTVLYIRTAGFLSRSGAGIRFIRKLPLYWNCFLPDGRFFLIGGMGIISGKRGYLPQDVGQKANDHEKGVKQGSEDKKSRKKREKK